MILYVCDFDCNLAEEKKRSLYAVVIQPTPSMASQPLDTESGDRAASKVPILLLKTRSTPIDAYEEILTTSKPKNESLGRKFDPQFVPVLRHRFDEGGMQRTRSLLQANEIGDRPGCRYGGMIFTSQRAVEAFTKVVNDERGMIHHGLYSYSVQWPTGKPS